MLNKMKFSVLQRSRTRKIITNIVIALMFIISVMAIATVLITPKLETSNFIDGGASAFPTVQYTMYSALWTSTYHLDFTQGGIRVFDGTTFSGLGIAALAIAIVGLVLGTAAFVLTSLRLHAVKRVNKEHTESQSCVWELVFLGITMMIMLIFLIISLLAMPEADSKETFFYAITTGTIDAHVMNTSTTPLPYTFAETTTSLGSALEFGGFGLLIISGGLGAIAVRTNSFIRK